MAYRTRQAIPTLSFSKYFISKMYVEKVRENGKWESFKITD